MSQRGMLDDNEIPDCAATLNEINQAVNLIKDNGNIIALKCHNAVEDIKDRVLELER